MSSLDYLLEQNSTRQVDLKRIEVSGDSHSLRDGFFKTQFDPVFNSNNLSGLLSQLETTANRLRSFGVHKSVSYRLDLDDEAAADKDILNLKAILSIEKYDSHWLKLSSITRNDEAGFNISGGWNNLFGGAESVSVNAIFNTRPRDLSSYALNFVSPIGASPYTKAILSYKLSSQTIPWASHSQVIKGFTGKLVNDLICAGNGAAVVRELGFEISNRSVLGVGAAASDTVRASSGDNLKVGINGTITVDSRDSIYYPTKGHSASITGEIVGSKLGFPGDVSYIKASTLASSIYSLDPINNKLVLSITGGLGLLHGDKTTILDRFYLGGAKDIYGFQYNGIGPKDDGDIVGGHGYAVGNISLFAKLPRLVSNDSPLRAIFLFNGASLVKSTDGTIKTLLNDIFTHPSTGAGVGFSYKTPNAQVELVYSVPLSLNSDDLTYKGLQFGVGISI